MLATRLFARVTPSAVPPPPPGVPRSSLPTPTPIVFVCVPLPSRHLTSCPPNPLPISSPAATAPAASPFAPSFFSPADRRYFDNHLQPLCCCFLVPGMGFLVRPGSKGLSHIATHRYRSAAFRCRCMPTRPHFFSSMSLSLALSISPFAHPLSVRACSPPPPPLSLARRRRPRARPRSIAASVPS